MQYDRWLSLVQCKKWFPLTEIVIVYLTSYSTRLIDFYLSTESLDANERVRRTFDCAVKYALFRMPERVGFSFYDTTVVLLRRIWTENSMFIFMTTF